MPTSKAAGDRLHRAVSELPRYIRRNHGRRVELVGDTAENSGYKIGSGEAKHNRHRREEMGGAKCATWQF